MITVYFSNLGNGTKEVSIHNGRRLVIVELGKKLQRWFWNWCYENHTKAAIVSGMTVFRFTRKEK